MVETDVSTRQRDASRPLVVDLDGTLLRTDSLVESALSLLFRQPLCAPGAIKAFLDGKAALKAYLAETAAIELSTMPLNDEFHALLVEEKAKGRKIYLASASDRRHVEQLADRVGLFDGVFASDGKTNLAGPAKAAALCEAFGEGRFDYAGNAMVDIEVWDKAHDVLVVNATPRVLRAVRERFPGARAVGGRSFRPIDYIAALRVHQWLKNLLIFVPALAAHQVGPGAILALLAAFLSFSLCASSAYLVNDLIDLRSDRDHPSKRDRPLASGAVPLVHGVLLVPVLLLAATALAAFLPIEFIAILAAYYALTLAYSLWLKRKMTIDVLVLACLYGMRLMAGGAAVAVPLSPWLGAFSIFLFLSLAIVKRCTELVDRIENGKGDPTGRGYQLRDLPILEAMAAAGGYVAVMVFALYINSPAVVALYGSPDRLWLICVFLIYWISRILVLTHRGEMHDDPIVFAATDRWSLVSAALIGAIVLASI